MLAAPVDVDGGVLVAPDTPGLGIMLDDDAVTRTRVTRIAVTARGVEHPR